MTSNIEYETVLDNHGNWQEARAARLYTWPAPGHGSVLLINVAMAEW